jgi:AcrR family transcriptional regulator
MPRKPRSEESAALERRRVVEAAIACVDEQGVAALTMEDLAARASIARRTVYRLFAGKLEVLEAISVERLDRIVERVRRRIAKCDSFRDALLLGSTEVVRLARADLVFMAVMRATVQGELMLYFVDPQSPIYEHSRKLWHEVLVRARASGELHPRIHEDRLHNWLRSVHLMLFMRSDLGRQGQIELLEEFVLPAIVVDGGG